MVLIGLVKIVIGIIVLALCIPAYRHRKTLARANAAALTTFFGKLGTAPARGSTPRWIGIISIGAVLIGSVFVVQGVFNVFSN